MWWAVAAAAAPYVISALQKKPKKPGAPSAVQLPDRSAYIKQILDQAMNPNNQSFKMASESAMEAVNRNLGRQGLGHSSIGGQLHNSVQSDLAMKFEEDKLRRMEEAMNVANNYDAARGNVDMNNNNAAYKHASDMFARQNQENANQVQGISSMIQAGAGAYQQSQTEDRWAADQAENKRRFDMMYNANFGAPGPQDKPGMPPQFNPYAPTPDSYGQDYYANKRIPF